MQSSYDAANMAQLHALEHKSAMAALNKKAHLEPETELHEVPHFLTQLRDLENVPEGKRAHFEAKLEPITDPHLQVEWLKDGQPVMVGHRFRPIHDFGYVALDIVDAISEDSGIYTCRATNLAGTCESKAKLICLSSTFNNTLGMLHFACKFF